VINEKHRDCDFCPVEPGTKLSYRIRW